MRQRIFIIIWALLLAAVAAFGQQGAGPVAGTITTTGGRQSAVMLMTDQGLMVLTNGVLAKYDSKTLALEGTVSLLPPQPTAPTMPTQIDQTTLQTYMQEMQQYRQALTKYQETPAMTILGQYLLVVMGDQFYRINTETLKIEVQSSVDPAPAAGADPVAAPAAAITGVTPILTLNGTALYVLRGSQMSVIEIKEGKVLASGTLPAAMAGPPPAVAGGGGGRVGRGGAGGGTGGPTAASTTLIGTIVNHADIEGGIWTVKTDAGDEYVLGGTALETLLATPDVEGKRARLTGTMVTGTGAAQYGKGTISVTDFQILQ